LERLDAGILQLDRVGGILGRFRELKAALEPLAELSGATLVDALFPENQPWAKALREAALLKINNDVIATKLLDVLKTSVTQPEMPESGDFVRVMSLHKSKGLTSKVVIVAECIEGLIPTVAREGTLAERQANLKEQRRLFYVAITRGTDVLVLSSVTYMPRDFAYRVGAQVRGAGGTIASRFLGELGPTAPAPKNGTRWQTNRFA
jgi:DNA helicase-2/ATP-dependent DNA helicase PcrA